MIDHVCLYVPDLAAARRFYDAVLGALGLPCVGANDTWIGYGLRADADHPHRTYVSIRTGTPAGAGFVWTFRARDAAAVAAFEAAGLAAGGRPAQAAPLRAPDRPWAGLTDPAGHQVAAVCEP